MGLLIFVLSFLVNSYNETWLCRGLFFYHAISKDGIIVQNTAICNLYHRNNTDWRGL